ncbi:MAG: hypothetical protein ABJA82_09475 [Myxococcales bacterium]
MEQPKKPGVAPTKDISDLKARLGLRKPDGGAPAAPMPGAPMQGQAHPQFPNQNPGNPINPMMGQPGRGASGGFAPVGPASQRPMAMGGAATAPAAAPSLDPFAGMKPQQGRFDLRSIDDGMPVEKVKAGAGKAVIITSFVVGIAAFVFGAGMGISSVGRANMNTANRAARTVKTELQGMQKTQTEINNAFLLSVQRLVAAKKDPLSYDPKLVEDLQKVKLDPRPDTSKIFRVDYYRLEDVVVDHLFNYYYDSLALYGEVERHIKRTKNDAESLQTFAEKDAAKQTQNYGVVFDTAGKLTVANLVEVGEQVCKGGAATCAAEQMEGFKIRSNTGAPWVVRKVSAKGDGVVPMKPTPLMDAVMSGSPDQVRAETYKQRVANIRQILARLNGTQKELMTGVDKAAARPDVFAPF